MAVKLALNSKEDYNLDQEVSSVPVLFIKPPNHLLTSVICIFDLHICQDFLSPQFQVKSTSYKFYSSHLGCPQCVCVCVCAVRREKNLNFVGDQYNTVLCVSQTELIWLISCRARSSAL